MLEGHTPGVAHQSSLGPFQCLGIFVDRQNPRLRPGLQDRLRMPAVSDGAIQKHTSAVRSEKTDHLGRHDRFVDAAVARQVIGSVSPPPPGRASDRR